MKKNRIIAALLALSFTGGAAPLYGSFAQEYAVTANAEEEYTEVTEGSLTFNVYSDRLGDILRRRKL